MCWLSVLLLISSPAYAGKKCWIRTKGVVGFSGWSVPEFQSSASWREQDARKAQVEMRDPVELDVEGLVVITIRRLYIQEMNHQNHSIVIESGGEQVARTQGGWNVLAQPTQHGAHWYTTLTTPILTGVMWPITVYAIDSMVSHRCSWTVDESGKIKRLKN